MRTPKAGSVLRAAFDAGHRRWCGPDCRPSCREWHPDEAELRAVIQAVRRYDAGPDGWRGRAVAWRHVADRLAGRLVHHAGLCAAVDGRAHHPQQPATCPFCDDTAAYADYVEAHRRAAAR